MKYSPLADLWRILGLSPALAIAFIAVTTIPLIITFVSLKYRKGGLLHRAFLIATALMHTTALIILLSLGPPAGVYPVGLLIFPFTIYFFPFWLLLAVLVWGALVVRRNRRKVSPPS